MVASKSPTKRLKAMADAEKKRPLLQKISAQAGMLKLLELEDGQTVFLNEYQYKVHASEQNLKRAFVRFDLDDTSELDWRKLIRLLASSFYSSQPVGNPRRRSSHEEELLLQAYREMMRQRPEVRFMSVAAQHLVGSCSLGPVYQKIKTGTLRKYLDRVIPPDERPHRK